MALLFTLHLLSLQDLEAWPVSPAPSRTPSHSLLFTPTARSLSLFLPLSLSVFSAIKAYCNVVHLITIVLGYPFSIFKCLLVLKKEICEHFAAFLLLFVILKVFFP